MEIKQENGKLLPSSSKEFADPVTHNRLQHLVAPHVESFNYFLEYGLDDALAELVPMEIDLAEGLSIRLQYTRAEIAMPSRQDELLESAFTPSEARESGSSYTGAMSANLDVYVNDSEESMTLNIKLGNLPLMVMSDKCHLKGKSCKQLVAVREEANEVGGYFILNGLERVIRLLQVPRRNHATAIERSSFKNRGQDYSDKGIMMRCTRRDNSSVSLTLHYLNNGGATLRFVLRKQEYLLPVVLVAKCLVDLSDKEIFDRIVAGDTENTFLTTRLELLLRDFKSYRLHSRSQCLALVGSLFRASLPIGEGTSDEEAGLQLIEMYLFVHCEGLGDKLECMLHMMRKLFSFVQGKCVADNADAFSNHDLLLPGHLFTMIVKEKMDEVFYALRQQLKRDHRLNAVKCEGTIMNPKLLQAKLNALSTSVGTKMGTFLSTGNLVSSSGLDLQQAAGFTIIAERLNILRYMSHFQSVHRGQFFTTMKTTAVRKLLPESWGFLCPVHTPDGSPCGLLNHLAREVAVVAFHPSTRSVVTPKGSLRYVDSVNPALLNRRTYIQEVLVQLGMVPGSVCGGDGALRLGAEHIPVLLDGVVLGGLSPQMAPEIVAQLRYLKAVTNNCGLPEALGSGVAGSEVSGSGVPGSGIFTADWQTVEALTAQRLLLDPCMEIAFVPRLTFESAYPGLYLFTHPGRLVRPVLQLGSRYVEWIGPMAQGFMEIAVIESDIRPGETTHIEVDPGVMLSQVAAMTPFSDYNQSPRNMYQCQMGKQTMGTPAHALRHRTDNKLYRIQNCQAPVVQTQSHRDYSMDDYPQGCNAVVAVISYTGYDMEDAMIINKAAYERGFGHGCVYKTHTYDLEEEERQAARQGGGVGPDGEPINASRPNLVFSNILPPVQDGMMESEEMVGEKFSELLDSDGLPAEGVLVQQGDPLVCFVDTTTGQHRVINHKDSEAAYIDTVRIIGTAPTARVKTSSAKAPMRRVSITLRYPRKPVIGDKFSSRHGQKGTLSVLWPQESMPFSEYGMSPDVLINPHAFPSRMTIGMLVESMAGKSGAVNGIFQDATPFQFHEDERVIDHVGEQLR
jgi:DNA-directed RNA polymerase I subunit RPA2